MAGCKANPPATGEALGAQTQNNEVEQTQTQNNEVEQTQTENIPDKATTNFVDLTQLSSTMLYSEVYNIMAMPEDYIGKTIKMNGQFTVFEGEPEDSHDYYFAVVIEDATACCQQGIEFVWSGEHSYPEDYPALGANITVTGVFETYTENERNYCHLVDSTVEIS